MPYKDPAQRRAAVAKSRAKHIEKRRAADRELKRKQKLADPERVNAKRREQYHATLKHNPARIKKAASSQLAWYRRTKYGVTQEQFDIMLEMQKGKCAICPQPAIAVDHCHVTGRVRGLLCRKCNSGLGFFNDSPDLVEAALRYLRGRN